MKRKVFLISIITVVIVAIGIIIPIIAKGDNNDAIAKYVLKGKSFTNGSAINIAGEMKSFKGQTPLYKQVDAEGEDYIATIDLDDGYYESVQINAKPIYDKGVAAGTTKHTETYTFPANDTGGEKDLGENHNYRKVNATNVYNKGKADGASGKKTVVYLGTGTSYTLTGYTGYKNFTKDNFIVEFVSLPKAQGALDSTERWAATANGTTVSKTYTASTGKLTISGVSQTVRTSSKYRTKC